MLYCDSRHTVSFFLVMLRWTALTNSTMGMMAIASPNAAKKFPPANAASLNTVFKPGMYITAIVKAKHISMDPIKCLLCPFMEKMDFDLDLMLREWNSSHMDRVRKAIVIPIAWDCAFPIKKDISVKAAMRIP